MNTLSEPVLVLNANFEPINVCTTRRAIGLILAEKVNLVLNGRGVIRTIYTAYPKPSIIRLERMVKRPRPIVKLNRREILRRDKHRCQYCGHTSSTLTIDHVLPRRLGGTHHWENLVTACSACNHKKGGRTLRDAGMKLIKRPIQPPGTAMYIYDSFLKANQDWVPFIEGW